MATTRRRPSTKGGSGEETRAKIVDAAIETLKSEGFLGTTARAIARTGDFNQALIFYHFGSVDDVLLSAVEKLGDVRLARYRDRVADAASFPELVAVAKDLLGEDLRDGYITVLAQMLAGSHAKPELGPPMLERFGPWIDLVEESIRKVVAGTPFEQLVPVRDLAYTITGMLMGIELLTQLDPEHANTAALFSTIDLVAGLLQMVLAMAPPPSDQTSGSIGP